MQKVVRDLKLYCEFIYKIGVRNVIQNTMSYTFNKHIQINAVQRSCVKWTLKTHLSKKSLISRHSFMVTFERPVCE
jgi:hypothetical protein